MCGTAAFYVSGNTDCRIYGKAVLEPYVFGLCALHGLCADFSAYPDQAFCHDVKEAGGGYDVARV